MPEAFLARFSVAALFSVVTRFCSLFLEANRSLRRLGLRPISPDAGEKKTSRTQGKSGHE